MGTRRRNLPSRFLLTSLLFTSPAIWATTEATAENPPTPGAASDSQENERSPGLDEMMALIREQQRQIEEQRQLIQGQQEKIDELNTLVEEVQGRLQEMETAAVESAPSEDLEDRLAAVETYLQDLPELPDDLVEAGDFPGSIKFPGTDAALRIGGQVRFNMSHNFDALGVDDRFVTAEIPMAGSEEAGKGPRTTLSVRPSRFNFDFRAPTKVGNLRAFIEGDFAGSGNTLRLRHAYGQWSGIVIGQTWSTFADPEAEPDGIDFEGLNAISLFRQPQVRWTHEFNQDLALSVAIEDPDPDVTNAGGVSQVPDVVVRGRRNVHTPREGHIHIALLLRQIRAEPSDDPHHVLSTEGWGLNASGAINAPFWHPADSFKFAVYYGRGIGRYITDLSAEGGQDAVYDPEKDRLDPLPVIAAYMGFEHVWSQQLRSTATYGTVYVENLSGQLDDAYHQTRRWTLNLSWSPIDRIDLVMEYLGGERINKDGQRGRARQFQFGSRYRF